LKEKAESNENQVKFYERLLTEKVKEKENEKTLYEKLLEEKDKLLTEKVKEKEKTLYEKLLEEKDKLLGEKDKLLGEKDERIKDLKVLFANIQAEDLRGKGLLTSRGIFERLLTNAFYETRKSQLEKFNATKMIALISDDTILVTSQSAPNFAKIREICRKCGLKDVAGLYATLSEYIHGSPWHGDGVKVFSNRLSQVEKCFIVGVAEYFQLEVTSENEINKVGEAG